MKKFLFVLLALVFVISVSACDPVIEGEPTTTDSITPTPENTNEVDLTVALVVAGGLGDRSFFDSAAGGLDMLVSEYGVTTKVVECKEDASMFKTSIAGAAETSDFVIAVGWQLYDALSEVATEMPDTMFIYIDESMEGIDNVFSIRYAQNEGSFLAGYIAAKMSETGIIGAVGGMEDAIINDFVVGYEQGAKYAKEDIEVKVIYANDYEDPARGKECALSLFDQGCDILFQIAGKTGEGVFEAAAEKGLYAIGVDTDQKYINEDVIICSMKKEVGNSIYEAISNYINSGTFKGGTTWVADMASNTIDIGYGDESMTQQVPEELKAEVEVLKQKIITGEIVVDSTR